jgi:hypothetical protein
VVIYFFGGANFSPHDNIWKKDRDMTLVGENKVMERFATTDYEGGVRRGSRTSTLYVSAFLTIVGQQ